MIVYPAIPGSGGQDFRDFQAYVFDKLDGNNLRFEWTKKRGWYKCGTRERLFDETDADFGPAVALFHDTRADALARIAHKERWQRLVVFAEYWGPKSLAGIHETGDDMRLTVFDAAPDKHGLLDPRAFRKAFEDRVETARCLGRHHWTRGFVARVRAGQLDGVTFEGVVGKSTDGCMAKAKTQAWIDAIIARHGETVGQRIIES